MDWSEGVVDFMAEDAHQALPGLSFLLAQGSAKIGKHHQGMGHAALPKLRAAKIPGS